MDVLSALGVYFLGLAIGVKVGFDLGKHVPYSRSLREEALRRAGIAVVYVQATVAVLIPAYQRRLRRKREEAREEFLRSLKPIERGFDSPDRT